MQQLDEGFFDTGASEAAMDDPPYDSNFERVAENALALPREQLLQLLANLCKELKTSELYDLHNVIGSMVYFDPVQYLPNELILAVFSHMVPKDLLIASQVSRAWRELTQDEQLWSDCFRREGWVLDKNRIQGPQRLAQKKGVKEAERMLRRRPFDLERRSSRKRQRDEAFNSETESTAVETGEEPGADVEDDLSDNADDMQGVENTGRSNGTMRAIEGNIPGTTMTAKDALMDFDDSDDAPPGSSIVSPAFAPGIPLADPLAVKIEPTVFTTARNEPKVSWPYLYKQRRRLERNWDAGKFNRFQLPHPEHEDDGHLECVYTIQHSGKHLVSGSRDRTIRIWDLDTYRLKLPPLTGHEASVLCLQFDDRPGERNDIIVSGGSDNYVIAWRFSTGQQIAKFEAHKESVLNLRFDDRYLITCSKDKSIKIWNRHQIAPDDPIIPAYAVSFFQNDPKSELIPSFTHLGTLSGHQAAVNAVQISGNTIVSASGDRTIKSWDIHSQSFKRSYTGHTKGIACVQFDGRRIVSGSSDNSVRIFDYETTAEVACLDGHANLVRTVQARFGDLQIISDEELLEESREADHNFLKALDGGMKPAEASRHRRPRNAGSSRPEDMLSYGTKVPPGGGGGKWAKIVSGSYDEQVIIWKRDPRSGHWLAHQKLPMVQNSPSPSTRPRTTTAPQNANQNNAQAGQAAQVAVMTNAHQLLNQAQNQLLQMNTILQQQAVPANQAQLSTTMTAAQSNLNVQMQALASQQHQHALNHGAAAAQNAAPAIAAANLVAANNQQHQPAANNQQQGHPHPHTVHHHHHHHGNGQHNAASRESNRVFKLQFDARRIIACSQNKVIVGWDFAAGDKDLEWIGDWSIETP